MTASTESSTQSHHDEKEAIAPARLVAYALGNFGQSAFYNALSTYFVVYVTNSLFSGVDKAVAGKLIGIITSLIVIIRIAEIFVDPLLGNLVDNTTTKLGRFRPWQLIGGLVSAVLIVMVYTGLFGLVNVNTTLFIVLFVVVFVVLDVFYSLRDISYWGMIPSISSDSHQRGIYTAAGTFTGSLGYNGLTIAVMPIVTFFSFDAGQQNQNGWTAFIIIVALLGALTALSVVFGVKEKQSTLRTKAQENGNPIEAFRALIHNDQLMWTALSYVFYAVANVATGGVMVYLFKYVIGRMDLFPVTGVIPIACGLIMSVLFPVITRWVPRRYLFLIGMSVMVVAYLLLIVASTNIPLLLVALVLFYLPQTQIQMTVIVCLEDSIEYGQLKTGKRNEAVTLSVRPMLDKIAGAFSNGFVGFVAVAAGMIGSATAADMTAKDITIFKTFAFMIPLVCIVLGLIVFAIFVKIDEKAHARLVAKLTENLATAGDGGGNDDGVGVGVGVGVGDNGEHNGGHVSIASEDSALAEYGPELAKRVLLGK